MHLCMLEKQLAEKDVAEKGLEDNVASRLSIVRQRCALISSEANHIQGYVRRHGASRLRKVLVILIWHW